MTGKTNDKRTKGLKFNFLHKDDIKEVITMFIGKMDGDEEAIRKKHSMSDKGTLQDLFKLQQEYDILLAFDRTAQLGYLYYDPTGIEGDDLPD